MAEPPLQRKTREEPQVVQGESPTVVRQATLIHAPAGGTKLADLPLPRRFGDYDLLEKIAQGGMGVVYRARQTQLDRIVAVKMILAGQFATDAEVERFRNEALAAAQLQHPSIVAIHEVGRLAGQYFFSMDYVEGHALGDLVREKPLPAARAAAYMCEIADAIHFAHQHGVLHRDLKPANVLVDRADRPRVTDFGLAKRIDQDSNLTATGAMLGTPGYMPPEQVRGEAAKLGAPSDVYALGAILYELLTTRPPFQGESALDTFLQVVNHEPISPRMLNAKVPRDLETICLKCLEKEPSRRYATAAELAADLRHFLAGEPILARPISRTERAWRWCRRRPSLASLATALVLTILASFAAVTWQWRAAEAQYQKTQQALSAAEKNLEKAQSAASQAAIAMDEMSRRRPLGMKWERGEQDLVRNVIKLHGELQQLSHGNPAAQLDSALGYARIGRGYLLLNQVEEASAKYLEAIAQVEALVAQDPQRIAYRQTLAELHVLHGRALQEAGSAELRQKAVAEYNTAIELGSQLIHEKPADPRHRHVLANAYYNLGRLHVEQVENDAARREFEQALTLQKDLVQGYPHELEFRHELARTHMSRGSLAAREEQLEMALAESEQAIALYHALTQEAKEKDRPDHEYLHESAACALNRGNVLSRLGFLAGNETKRHEYLQRARHEYGEAIGKLLPLTNRFPGVPSYLQDLANSYNADGVVQAYEISSQSPDDLPKAASYAEIVETWSEARRVYGMLVDIRPEVVDYHRRLADVLSNLAQIQFRTDHSENLQGTRRAVETLGAAIEHQQLVLQSNPGEEVVLRLLATMHGVRAQALLNLEDASHAAEDAAHVIAFAPADAELIRMALEVLSGCLVDEDGNPNATIDTAKYASLAAETIKHALGAALFSADELRENLFLKPLLARPEMAGILELSDSAASDPDVEQP